MKWALIAILIIHGLLHLLGAAKGLHWADIPTLTSPINRMIAILWLTTTLLFFGTAFLLIRSNSMWWLPAALAVLLSIYLIGTAWQDARWGMIPNVFLALITLVGFAQWQFDRQVAHAEKSLFEASFPLVEMNERTTLPAIVDQWLDRSAMPERGLTWVHLEQEGTMKISPEGSWLPFTAKQQITPQHPGFVWSTEATLLPGIFFLGRDQYKNGKGKMLIRLLGILPVVNVSNPEIDQGALLRYLGELVWLPSGALHPAIEWEEVNPTSAKATLHWGQVSATGTFTFSPSGDFQTYSALRYYHRPEGSTMEEWQIKATPGSEAVFQGCRIPTQFAVIWKLKEGDFHWLNLKVTAVEYGFE